MRDRGAGVNYPTRALPRSANDQMTLRRENQRVVHLAIGAPHHFYFARLHVERLKGSEFMSGDLTDEAGEPSVLLLLPEKLGRGVARVHLQPLGQDPKRVSAVQ